MSVCVTLVTPKVVISTLGPNESANVSILNSFII